MARYYTKPQPVEAWQYNGEIVLSKLPGWVLNLVLHKHLVYFEVTSYVDNRVKHGPTKELRYYDGLTQYFTVSEGDWLVNYNECTIGVVPDAKFKKSFEKAESRSITTTIVE